MCEKVFTKSCVEFTKCRSAVGGTVFPVQLVHIKTGVHQLEYTLVK